MLFVNLNRARGAALRLFLCAPALVLTSCGGSFSLNDLGPAPYTIESYNMDGTKLIVNGLRNQQESGTLNQDQYFLDNSRRLLMRFENLIGKVDDIKNSWDDILNLRIVPTDPAAVSALRAAVKLCPVTKNWMMLATWYQAHPFNKNGQWSSPGGDFDAASCIVGEIQLPKGTRPSPSPTPNSSVTKTLPSPRAESPAPDTNTADRSALIFDIRPWFLSNPEGRENNFGFILIAESPVVIFGDRSSAYSPRLYWKKTKARRNGTRLTP